MYPLVSRNRSLIRRAGFVVGGLVAVAAVVVLFLPVEDKGTGAVILLGVAVAVPWFAWQITRQAVPARLATGPPVVAKPSMREQYQADKAAHAARDAKIVCEYCREAGGITTRQVRRAKRKTATRIGFGIATLGGSIAATGVSKKGTVTEMRCSNCGMQWDVAIGSSMR